MPITYYTAEVIDIIDETPDVKRYFFRVLERNDCDFIPGQFTMLDLPIESKQTTRAYSIASAPSLADNVFELIIVLKPDGLGTPHLWENVKIGDKLKASAPIGKFGKPRPNVFEREICFICTGTGIAPFRSMILDIKNYNIPYHKLTMLFGCRYEKDILYKNEMLLLQEQMPNFEFHPVLSRENDNWNGHKGYVHDVYKARYAHKPDVEFLICGWKNMILDAVKHLKEMGYEKPNVRYELYD
jgi:CDP-4-dehydro-6-deoxyglucose reductase